MKVRWTDAPVSSVCFRSSVGTLLDHDHDGGDMENKTKQKQQEQNNSPAMLIYPKKYCRDWTLFSCKSFHLLQKINIYLVDDHFWVKVKSSFSSCLLNLPSFFAFVAYSLFPSIFWQCNGRLCQERVLRSRIFATMVKRHDLSSFYSFLDY